MVANTIEARSSALSDITLDFANWDDAYQAISVRWDEAWVENNYYSSVTDGLVIFHEDGAVRHVWVAESFQVEAAELSENMVAAARALPNLNRLMRAPTAQETVAHTILALDGRLALISVAPIQPEENAVRRLRAADGDRDYLVVIDLLDASEIDDISRSLGLRDFDFEGGSSLAREGQIFIPLLDASRTLVGAMRWRDEKPGDKSFAAKIIPVLLGLLIIGALTLTVAHRLVLRQVANAARAEAALESSRLKSEFIATMSHELRTPLNAIIGYAELIQEESSVASEIIHDDATHIVSAANHLRQLINDILDQSRIEAGHLSLRPEPLSAGDLLVELDDLIAPLARANGNSFTTDLENDALFVVADHQRVRQCLLNLASNAVKFTKNGAVAVRARHSVQNNVPYIVFDVTDTGGGIASEHVACIFEPFGQANEEIQRDYGGTGLGLAISRKLARAMGGDITVSSELGRGSCFSLSLPVGRVPELALGACASIRGGAAF